MNEVPKVKLLPYSRSPVLETHVSRVENFSLRRTFEVVNGFRVPRNFRVENFLGFVFIDWNFFRVF